MSANTSHYIFDGYDTYHGSNPFRLELFYESGAYKLRSRAMKDDWGYNSSNKYTLSNAWHFVEIEWQASSAAGANNGFLSLWIDGTLVETLSALDNDDTAGWLDEVRLGATNNLDATTSGSMLFDNFESRRNTYIGPVSSGPTHTPTPTVTASVTPTPSKTSTPSQTPTKTFTPSVTATPSKTSTPSQTPTKTSTPSATPTRTPTASHTPSPTPTSQGGGGTVSINASFQYDGDGKRVSQNINGVITYFVGNYYEQTGSTVTKYYYAGSSRIAMRTGTTLYYLLSDHLGSTSLTTDSTGNVISEMRYTPWGEVRYNAGVTPTDYQFTGQMSYTDDFGLLYFNARWVDPYIGRFAQADTIVPEQSQGVQAWDRYAYTNNNPLRYTDSTGHCIDGVSTILCVMAVSAVVNVAIDYAVTTYVLKEEYTWKDAAITAGISIVTAGTGNFLTTAVTKSALSATAKFAAKIFVQQGVTVAGNYLQREAKSIPTTMEDIGVDLIGGTFAGLISTSSSTSNIPYLDEVLTPSTKASIAREVETTAEVFPVMYSGAYSVTKKFINEKSKTYAE